uniref:Uncharacterized protein n=1 Tax=Spongospora subterranea TaxID=70186 RepID=A0A0H5R8K7_9EUKA|eukprot:CRZ10136.1 hypothetical protein [Spongospora subterranea]
MGPESASLLPLDLDRLRRTAISIWRRQVLTLCICQIACTAIALATQYWYMVPTSLITFSAGIYGAIFSKSEFVFAHLVLLCLSELADVMLICRIALDIPVVHLFISSPILLIFATLFFALEIVLILPINFYCAYYLYQSLHTEFMSLRFDTPGNRQ